jgi:hypothetical protein
VDWVATSYYLWGLLKKGVPTVWLKLCWPGSCVVPRLYCSVGRYMNDSGVMVEWYRLEKWSTWREVCYSETLSFTTSTWTGLELNQGLCSERLVAECLPEVPDGHITWKKGMVQEMFSYLHCPYGRSSELWWSTSVVHTCVWLRSAAGAVKCKDAQSELSGVLNSEPCCLGQRGMM